MVIGLTLRKYKFDNQEKYYINEEYIKLLKKYNITPIFISNENINYLINICDGVIITGGYDINPNLYNQDNINSKNIDDELDNLDIKVIEYCVNNKLPCLGICRGLQIINVYFKGTLHQNIDKKHYKNLNSKLFINNKKYSINSFHHQGIDKLGDDLVSIGISDEIIEYIKHRYLPIIGTQFHIEKDGYLINKLIFESYIKIVENHL